MDYHSILPPKVLRIEEEPIFLFNENTNNTIVLKLLIQRSVPVTLRYLLQHLCIFITMLYAGSFHNTKTFAGISLTNLIINMTFMSVMFGMSSSSDTLCSQYYGASNFKQVGLTLQRSFVILVIMSIPILVTWHFSEYIFMGFGIEKEVCMIIHSFLQVRVWSLPADIFNISYDSYLVSMGINHPSNIYAVVFIIILSLSDYVFIYWFEYGYLALAWAFFMASYVSGACMIIFSLKYKEVQLTLQPISFEVFDGEKLLEYLKLGFPGLVMTCSEWWAWELLGMFASILGTDSIAALSIVTQYQYLTYTIPLGIASATTSLLGNAIGSQAHRSIQFKIIVKALIMVVFMNTILGVCIFYFSNSLINCFTNDVVVIRLTNQIIPLLAILVVPDGISCVCIGALKGLGKQKIGAVTGIVSYYCIGLPLAVILAFSTSIRLGLSGLVIGTSVGTCMQVACLLYYLTYYGYRD